MDSILGIGLPELVVILILASLVMGPQRIRHVARTLGRITAQLQGISRQFARQLNAELDALDGDDDVRGAVQDMRSLQQEVEALRRELGGVHKSLINEGKSAVREGEAALKGEGAPKEKLSPKDKAAPAGESPPTSTVEKNGPPQSPQKEKSSETPDSKKPSLPSAIEVPGDPA